jgi:hypothetical protein
LVQTGIVATFLVDRIRQREEHDDGLVVAPVVTFDNITSAPAQFSKT